MSKTPETPESSDLLIEHFSDRSVRRLLQDNEYARGLIEIVAPELVAFLLILHRRPVEEREDL